MASKPPTARSVSARNAMVEPRANSAWPSRRATSTLGANSVAMPSASHARGPRIRAAPGTGRSPGRRPGRPAARRRRAGSPAPRGCRYRSPAAADSARAWPVRPGCRPWRWAPRWRPPRPRCRATGNSRCSRAISSSAGSSGSPTPKRISNSGIVLRGVRTDGLVEAGIAPVHGLEDGDRDERLAHSIETAPRHGSERRAGPKRRACSTCASAAPPRWPAGSTPRPPAAGTAASQITARPAPRRRSPATRRPSAAS